MCVCVDGHSTNHDCDYYIALVFIACNLFPFRLQELEDQYRKEREEASNLLEQQRLVRDNVKPKCLGQIMFCFIMCFYWKRAEN